MYACLGYTLVLTASNFIQHIYKEKTSHVDQSAEQTQQKQNPSNTNQDRIITPCKETRSQSRLESYLVLNKDHEMTKYIEAVRDRRQTQVFTKYRPSDHKVTTEQRRSGSRAHWSGYTSSKRCQMVLSYS